MIQIPVEDVQKYQINLNQPFMGIREFKRFPFAEVDSIIAPFITKSGEYEGFRTMIATNEDGMNYRGYVVIDKQRVFTRTQTEFVKVGNVVCQMTVLRCL